MMMKVRWSPQQSVWLECDVSNPKDAVKEFALFGELFKDTACGQCGATDIWFDFRTVDTYEYFSLKCNQCGAELKLGQSKDGKRLFVKRKNEDGSWDSVHRGWAKFTKKENHDNVGF